MEAEFNSTQPLVPPLVGIKMAKIGHFALNMKFSTFSVYEYYVCLFVSYVH